MNSFTEASYKAENASYEINSPEKQIDTTKGSIREFFAQNGVGYTSNNKVSNHNEHKRPNPQISEESTFQPTIPAVKNLVRPSFSRTSSALSYSSSEEDPITPRNYIKVPQIKNLKANTVIKPFNPTPERTIIKKSKTIEFKKFSPLKLESDLTLARKMSEQSPPANFRIRTSYTISPDRTSLLKSKSFVEKKSVYTKSVICTSPKTKPTERSRQLESLNSSRSQPQTTKDSLASKSNYPGDDPYGFSTVIVKKDKSGGSMSPGNRHSPLKKHTVKPTTSKLRR